MAQRGVTGSSRTGLQLADAARPQEPSIDSRPNLAPTPLPPRR
jgi:hypothetical protein